MTTPTLTIRGPEHAVALVPFLLGFVPQESLVGIWVRDAAVVLTQRIDLPAGLAEPRQQSLATQFVALADRARADGLVLLAFTESEPSEEHADLMTQVATCAEDRGITVLDALEVRAGRYRSTLCSADCCPQEGTPVRQSVSDEVAAAFAISGVAALGSRAEVVASLQSDPPAVARIEPLVVAAETDDELCVLDTRALEVWRDTRIDLLLDLLAQGAAIDDRGVVAVLTGLTDIRVRDTVAWHLARSAQCQTAFDALTAVTRAAPEGYVAPAATACAMLAWFLGDGARACIALDRALADDPGYALARLVEQAVQAGLPPGGWRAALAAMSEDDLRVRDPAA